MRTDDSAAHTLADAMLKARKKRCDTAARSGSPSVHMRFGGLETDVLGNINALNALARSSSSWRSGMHVVTEGPVMARVTWNAASSLRSLCRHA